MIKKINININSINAEESESPGHRPHDMHACTGPCEGPASVTVWHDDDDDDDEVLTLISPCYCTRAARPANLM
jgi:hypothetical protein